MSGWIKLHRKLTEWEWYSDVNTSRVFLHLLLVANHKDNQWRGIHIKRGQRLTSLSGLSKETSLSIKNIRTAIKRLKTTHEVASHSTAQHTVFTVLNYDLYQDEAHETASEWQARGKQGASNNNDKNDNNENKINPLVQPKVKQKKVSYSDYHLAFAKWMHSLILNINPNAKEPNFESWANTIRLMTDIDKRNGDEMVKVFQWANQDSFWNSNILSADKFRKQYDQLSVKSRQEDIAIKVANNERTQDEVDQFTAELNDQFERSQASKQRREARSMKL